MFAIVSLLIIVSLSILITRIATIALVHTGLSREAARFQARSALSGSGFTTTESEKVVNHPVRRRIILLLMLIGNAGIVTAVSSLILAFVDNRDSGSVELKIAIVAGGITGLWLLSMSQWVDRRLSAFIERVLKRHTRLDVRDYASLMHLTGEYRIVELEVEPDDWLDGRTLRETKLRDEGLMVLGIRRRDGTFLGVPNGDSRMRSADTLILYGRITAIESVDQRRKDTFGDHEHAAAVREHEKVRAEEQAADSVQESGDPRP